MFDTNALLHLYRVPDQARAETVALLKQLSDRIWIPYHVGLEFQRNRLGVIVSQRQLVDDTLKECQDALAVVRGRVEKLDLDRQGIDVRSAPLLEALENAHSNLSDAVKKAQDKQLALSHADSVRDSIDELFAGKVGPRPADQAAVEELQREADERYSLRVPPGFNDLDKDRDPKSARFVADGLTYSRKCGDLIVWRQTLEHVRSIGSNSVIFITSDKKDDWWLQVQGKTIGPHPELVAEMRRVAGVENFWMYSLVQFVEYANNQVGQAAQVSTESLDELRDVASSFTLNVPIKRFYRTLKDEVRLPIPHREVSAAVQRWLAATGRQSEQGEFPGPELISVDDFGVEGFEIKRLDSWLNLKRPRYLRQIADGLSSLQGEVDQLHLILVVSKEDAGKAVSSGGGHSLMESAADLILMDSGLASVTVGTVVGGMFRPIATRRQGEADGTDEPA
ncbi:PIN-like domain-containing protein [Cognatilysobacter bugurensis]|uniref:PIN-like domain-containing protein n=1 Tax=Cognatilysobacter bugurensis TaxID=543356 RepID=UPI001E6150CC|nr:PIN-like domain-containing protein [Lysobacter bugurensis]